MALPTPEYVNTWLGQLFEADCINRKKIKTLTKYNKLSIKTKIKRLKDNLKANIEFLQYKFIRDVKIAEQGGHPDLGYEENYETNLDDDVFKALLKGKKRWKRDLKNNKQKWLSKN